MGYQERRVEMISTRASPHLEPGEQIQTGTGPAAVTSLAVGIAFDGFAHQSD